MYYTVYKVTNQMNGKFYIGTHKTKNLDDDYMGSGRYLNRAIQKYGIENFTKEILHIFDNPQDMFEKESEIVTEDFLAEENTYNLKIGGMGGWDYVNENGELRIAKNKKAREITNKRHKDKLKKWSSMGGTSARAKHGPIFNLLSIELQNKVKTAFKGKSHTKETKRKIAEANRSLTGKRNSQYGTMWITNGQENKKIKNTDSIPEGWDRGRIMRP